MDNSNYSGNYRPFRKEYLNTRPVWYYVIEFFNANDWLDSDNVTFTRDLVANWWFRSYPLYHFNREDALKIEPLIIDAAFKLYYFNNSQTPF